MLRSAGSCSTLWRIIASTTILGRAATSSGGASPSSEGSVSSGIVAVSSARWLGKYR